MPLRKEQRVAVRLPVSINRRAALSADISSEGFCLESPTLLGSGAEVTGFVLHGPLELAFRGRVAWVAPGSPMASTWHRMGVRFTNLSPGLRALLAIKQRG